MCDPVSLAVGATVISAGGSLMQGAASQRAANATARQQTEQARVERLLGAVEDDRTRTRMRARAGEMRAQLAARGVQLDSPSAIALAETAAREMSFASQDVRGRSGARVNELGAASRQSRALGRQAMLQGVTNAAGTVLTGGSRLWPSLASGGPSTSPVPAARPVG